MRDIGHSLAVRRWPSLSAFSFGVTSWPRSTWPSARQLERLILDVAGLKDDMTVVMARLDRIDATAA